MTASPLGPLMESRSASPRIAPGNYDIWQLAVGKSGGESEPVRITSDPSNDYAPAVGPDGQHLAFVSERQPQGIWSKNLRSDDAPELLEELLGTTNGLSFSPDSWRLLFQNYDRGSTSTYLGLVELYDKVEPRKLSESGEDVFPSEPLGSLQPPRSIPPTAS